MIPALLAAGLLLSAAPSRADSFVFGAPTVTTGGFLHPSGLALDRADGRILVADTGHGALAWASWCATGVCGSFSATTPTGALALVDPGAVAADASGHAYVGSLRTGAIVAFRWSNGAYVADHVLLGAGAVVGGTAVLFPRDLAVDPLGAVYLLDSGNRRILTASGFNATSWSVYKQDLSWSDPYGIDIDTHGLVYVADTGNHRIVKYAADGTKKDIGSWGTQNGQFRFPRDVAADGAGHLLVADTYNHRVQALAPDGHFLASVGQAPTLGTIDKIVVDAGDRVAVLDSDNNAVISFAAASPPYDPFIRDYIGDTGDEPSDPRYYIDSPDILVRHQADVNLASAAAAGLESYALQAPVGGEISAVYVAVHNRGAQAAPNVQVRLYAISPGAAGYFPVDWSTSSFYSAYASAASNTPGNTLDIPAIPAGGTAVAGPLYWQPSANPNTLLTYFVSTSVVLGARVSSPFDFPPTGDSLTMARDSNKVTKRLLPVLPDPLATGTQNTLVVRVNYPDLTTSSDANAIDAMMAGLNAWISSVSWNQASVSATQRGPVTLPNPRSYYANTQGGNTPLFNLPTDAMSILLQAEPHLLDQYQRVIFVTNDTAPSGDWAMTGPFNYYIKGVNYTFSTSIQGMNDALPLFAHGLLHQLGMIDLYAYDGYTLGRPDVTGWDPMDKPFNLVHPLVLSKEEVYWVSSHGARILFVPRPAANTTWTNNGQPIALRAQELAGNGDVAAVAYGLTNGITDMHDETEFYFVEARQQNAAPGDPDDAISGNTVLGYYFNAMLLNGAAPAWLYSATPSDPVAIGQQQSLQAPPDAGLQVSFSPVDRNGNYNITTQYSPPATGYDLQMHAGDPFYESPDIWIVNQEGGSTGIAGEPNQLFARVTNNGPADAHDVEVDFKISEPMQTPVGDFLPYQSVYLDTVFASTPSLASVSWTPRIDVASHTCVAVHLYGLNDTDIYNNDGQHNFEIDHAEHGSPYTPFTFQFQIGNSSPTAQLFLFQARGIPKGWTWSLTPRKQLVQPHQIAYGTLKIQPPLSQPDCTSRDIDLTGWTPKGDTLIRVGDIVVTVDLQKKTAITLSTGTAGCGHPIIVAANAAACHAVVRGCTTPPQPNQTIVLRYVGPDGQPVYHEVTTDARGCYSDSYVAAEGGPWQVSATYNGTRCQGPASTQSSMTLPGTIVEHDGGDALSGDNSVCLSVLSENLRGRVTETLPEAASSSCQTKSLDQTVELAVSTDAASGVASLGGTLKLTNLRHLLTYDANKGAGLHRGRFEWATPSGFRAVGEADGISQTGSHHKPFSSKNEDFFIPGHLEVFLNGTVVAGPNVGSRLRASVALDLAGSVTALSRSDALGALEGVVEKACPANKTQAALRVKHALADAAKPPLGPCKGQQPCIDRIAKRGDGDLALKKSSRYGCGNNQSCQDQRWWKQLVVPMTGDATLETRRPVVPNGRLIVDSLIDVESGQGRGEEEGRFEYLGDGFAATGTLVGVTQAGTHREPLRSSSRPGRLKTTPKAAFTAA